MGETWGKTDITQMEKMVTQSGLEIVSECLRIATSVIPSDEKHQKPTICE
jgi:hypothetical protein